MVDKCVPIKIATNCSIQPIFETLSSLPIARPSSMSENRVYHHVLYQNDREGVINYPFSNTAKYIIICPNITLLILLVIYGYMSQTIVLHVPNQKSTKDPQRVWLVV